MNALQDRMDLIALIQAWGIYRDQGRWDSLAETFHPGGTIAVTWFSGSFSEFIEQCRARHKDVGPRTKHLIGLPHLEISGSRAVAETNIQILGRVTVNGIPADNICYARFLDRIEKRNGTWRIVEREAIYEKDRIDPVEHVSGFATSIAGAEFSSIPEPYRYLGHYLRASGRKLCDRVLCDGSPDTLAAQARALDWLHTEQKQPGSANAMN